MDALLNLIPGGSLTAILAAVGAVLLFAWRALAGAKKAGVDQQKAKEAVARDKNLEQLKRAAAARPVGGVHDDPHNRDNH